HTRKISPEAYEAYLRGLYQTTKSGSSENAIAIACFTEAVNKQPDFLAASLLLAESKVLQYEKGWDQRTELLDEAETTITNVLKNEKTNAQAFAVYGSIEQLRGNQSKAMEYFQRSLSLDGHNIAALTRAAILYFDNLGEPAKAVTYLKRVHELNPNDAVITSNLGIGYAQLKNYTEAKHMFWKAVELQPNIDYPWTNLGLAYQRLGVTDSAMFCYEKAIEFEPAKVLIYEDVLPLLISLKYHTRAESLITSGMKVLQSSHELFYFLGLSYEHSGKNSEAQQTYKQGLRMVNLKREKNPNIPEYHMYASLFSAKLHSRTEAVNSAQRAIELDSTNSYTILNRAKVAALLGEMQEMLSWYEKARTLNSDFDEAYLATAIEFEQYRNDADLLLIARMK
ncbi:MAG: tetratricopeptide repeat protein, partial [Ignavibacteriae bacterium]|nr:tetratricopeptide repeat protein [Ignavibacteriota bacterium]